MTATSRRIIATFCQCVALLGALFLGGCGESSAPSGATAGGSSRQWGGGTGHATWNQLKKINPKAELDEVTACYASIVDIMGSEHLVYAIFTDFEGSCNARTWATASGTRKYEGLLQRDDEQKIEWQCETAVEKPGEIRINGSAYDLGKGRLFLVSTLGGQVQVRQVQPELRNVKPNGDSLESLLKDDPDVEAFLSQTAKAG